MLHISQDPPCLASVRFWNSSAGADAFLRLVGTFVQPPPRPDDVEAMRALRDAVPPTLVATSEADVDMRVHDAARNVAERLRLTRQKVARFYDFCANPAPPRHSCYVGPSDRPETAEEMVLPAPSNPHFQRWLAAAGLD